MARVRHPSWNEINTEEISTELLIEKGGEIWLEFDSKYILFDLNLWWPLTETFTGLPRCGARLARHAGTRTRPDNICVLSFQFYVKIEDGRFEGARNELEKKKQIEAKIEL